ncbi:hypothetical protein C6A85_12095, partial [Mycobacterium sp. ITM-2017-0098]
VLLARVASPVASLTRVADQRDDRDVRAQIGLELHAAELAGRHVLGVGVPRRGDRPHRPLLRPQGTHPHHGDRQTPGLRDGP